MSANSTQWCGKTRPLERRPGNYGTTTGGGTTDLRDLRRPATALRRPAPPHRSPAPAHLARILPLAWRGAPAAAAARAGRGEALRVSERGGRAASGAAGGRPGPRGGAGCGWRRPRGGPPRRPRRGWRPRCAAAGWGPEIEVGRSVDRGAGGADVWPAGCGRAGPLHPWTCAFCNLALRYGSVLAAVPGCLASGVASAGPCEGLCAATGVQVLPKVLARPQNLEAPGATPLGRGQRYVGESTLQAPRPAPFGPGGLREIWWNLLLPAGLVQCAHRSPRFSPPVPSYFHGCSSRAPKKY